MPVPGDEAAPLGIMSSPIPETLSPHHPAGASGFVGVAPGGIDYYESELGKIRVPTLIVWGEKDSIAPLAMGERMESKIEGSRLIVLKDARHPCYLDRPEEFHQALIDFLKASSKD